MLAADADAKPIPELLPDITLAVAGLTRVSVQQKRWQTEFREKARKGADSAAGMARKRGLSDDAV